MRPLNAVDEASRAEQVVEYQRLAGLALDALREQPARGRPDWTRFLQVHEEMSKVADRIALLTFGSDES